MTENPRLEPVNQVGQAPAPPLLKPGQVPAPPLEPIEWVPAPPLAGSTPPAWEGPVGPTGPSGPQGPQGAPGADSTVPGPTGPPGATGAVGPAGATGAASTVPGPQGPAGAPGATGAAGADSTVPGPPGATGSQGPKGDTGATGATGAASTVPGPPGSTGATGPQGNPGTAGAPGATGATGPGVAAGGTAGQVLSKIDATNYNTQWITPFTQAQADALYQTPAQAAALYLPLVGGSLAGPGNLNVAGTLKAGDTYASRGASSGALFFGTDGNHYLYFDGTQYQLAVSPLMISAATLYLGDTGHAVASSGGNNLYLAGAGGTHFFWGASSTYAPVNTGTLSVAGSASLTGSLVMPRGQNLMWGDVNTKIYAGASDNDIRLDTWVNLQINSMGYATGIALFAYPGNLTLYSGTIYFANNGGINITWNGSWFAFTHTLNVPGIRFATNGQTWSEPGGAVIGASWTVNAPGGYTQTSHEKVKDHITVIDPGCWQDVLLDDSLRGLHYQRKDDPDHRWEYGFSADKWHARVPEAVSVDADGEPSAMYYTSVIPFLWEAVRYLLKERAA